MTVRPAAPGDAERIAHVHVEGWRVGYRDLVDADHLAALDERERADGWRRALTEGARVLVVEAAGTVQGMSGLGPARDGDVPTGTGEIYSLYVDPDRWSAGLGGELLTGAVQALRADGFGTLVLWVLADNTRSRRFYGHHGWVPDGAVKVEEVGGRALDHVRLRLGV